MDLKNKINQFFKKDIYTPTKKEFLIISLFLGVAVYLEILIFQPAGLYGYSFYRKHLFMAGYGIMEFLVFLIFFAIPITYLRKGKENSKVKVWEILTLLAVNTSIMAVCIDFHHKVWFPDDYTNTLLIRFPSQVRNVLSVGLLPFTFLTFWILRKDSAANLLANNRDATGIDSLITIKSSQRGIDIKIKISDILYMKSDRNYVEIHYLEDNVEKTAVHRASLSSMIEELPEGLFCRIHNSYLVSLSFMSAPFTVNSAYFVRLDLIEETILPVSRTYLKGVREVIVK